MSQIRISARNGSAKDKGLCSEEILELEQFAWKVPQEDNLRPHERRRNTVRRLKVGDLVLQQYVNDQAEQPADLWDTVPTMETNAGEDDRTNQLRGMTAGAKKGEVADGK